MKKDLGLGLGKSGINFVFGLLEIEPIKKLEDLCEELSIQVGKKVEIVDIIGGGMGEQLNSLITGKRIDCFLKDYKNKGFSYSTLDTKKNLNEEKNKYYLYKTMVIFKEK